jgi:threonine dehydrogenase-like Zn-dependent dehydrogenase
MGSAVKPLQQGDRVVASLQIAVDKRYYCYKKYSLRCERTNSNTFENYMYGDFHMMELFDDVSLIPPIHQISVTIVSNAGKRLLLSFSLITLLMPFPC